MNFNAKAAIGFVTILLAGWTGSGVLAATNTWLGAYYGNMNWSTASCWSFGTVPSSQDHVLLRYGGYSPGETNSIVDAAFPGLIGTLQLQPHPGHYGTLITPGQVLVVTGDFLAGSSGGGANTNIFTGPGGTLIVSNAIPTNTITVGNWSSFGLPPIFAGNLVDMSGLDSFGASVSRVRIADGLAYGTSSNIFARGSLLLAKTNEVIASNIGVGAVGYSNVYNLSDIGKDPAFLVLGQSNSFSIGAIGVGGELVLARVIFNAQFSNSTARFRGIYGTNRINSFTIADGVNGGFFSYTSNLALVDFSRGTVDLQVDKLLIGRVRTNAALWSGFASRGKLRFADGIVDVNKLELGQSLNPQFGLPAEGTVEVIRPGKLIVNTSLDLGNRLTGNSFDVRTRGIVNIDGGTVMARMINADFLSRSNAINMTNGTLIVSNKMGPGIFDFVMADSTLQLPAATTPSAIVTNLVTGGTSNIINVGSTVGLYSYPTQVALIKYQGVISGAGFNFALGTLPQPAHLGFLSNNTVNSSVDVVLDLAPTLAANSLGDQLALTLTGPSNRIVDILSSTNLSDWSWLVTVTNTSGAATILDSTTNETRRFFRARQWP